MNATAKRTTAAPIRRVVRASLELAGWSLELDCGHIERAPDHDSAGLPVTAPKLYQCTTCGAGEV